MTTQQQSTRLATFAVALDLPLNLAGPLAFTALDFAFSRLKVVSEPSVELVHIGSGKTISFDAGTSVNDYLYDIHFTRYPTLKGSINTTDLIYIRSCHHMRADARLRDCTTGLRCDFSVCSQFNIVQSSNQEAWAVKQPTNTIVLDKRTRDDFVVEPSTANRIWVISEGVSGFGIDFAHPNTVLPGGTSEGSYGRFIRAAATRVVSLQRCQPR